MLMGMGLIGWIVSLVIGFVVGGIFFLTIKLQVEYVEEQRGPAWVMPACMYARMLLLGVVLTVVAVTMRDHGESVPAAMLAGVAGLFAARVLVSRMVRKGPAESDEEDGRD